MYISDLDKKIRQLRKQSNLTQAELASKLGLSKSVISAYENGTNSPPYDVLIHIAKLFGVSTDYLLGVTGNKTINVDGLTQVQVESISRIIQELKAVHYD